MTAVERPPWARERLRSPRNELLAMLRNGPALSGEVAFAVFALFWASMALSLDLWVFRGAGARGSSRPALWALASVFTPVGLPYYLFRRFRRGGFGDRERPPTGRDRLLATWAAASLVAFGVGSVASPPDPFSQLLYTLGALCATLPLAYLLLYRGGRRSASTRTGGRGG